jgi:hypothetical protein
VKAEKSPLLEAVAKKHLVREQAEKWFSGCYDDL